MLQQGADGNRSYHPLDLFSESFSFHAPGALVSSVVLFLDLYSIQLLQSILRLTMPGSTLFASSVIFAHRLSSCFLIAHTGNEFMMVTHT